VSTAEEVRLRSRRALLAGAAGVAGGVVLAGCGGKPLREKIRGGASTPGSDIDVLNSLLAAENYGIAAWAVGIPLLSRTGQMIGKQFLSQELAHAGELSDLIKGAGGKPPARPASYNLGDPHTEAEAWSLLQNAERIQLNAYLEMVPVLSGGRVRAAIATIFANDAQHLAVIRSQSGQSLPGAFAVT
jgi:hypothetical protein